jgi:hypothetical protein
MSDYVRLSRPRRPADPPRLVAGAVGLALTIFAISLLLMNPVETVPPPDPTITSTDPNSVVTGTESLLLTVHGTNFNATSVVKWNGSALDTTYVSSTELEAFVLDINSPVDANVMVENIGPPHRESNTVTVSVNDCLPDPSECEIGPGEDCECALIATDICEMTNTFDAELGHLRLELGCTPPPSTKSAEANVYVTNNSADYEYRVRVRAEVVCPPDPNEPDICMCPNGFDDWWDASEPYLCDDSGCGGGGAGTQPYPKQMKSQPGPIEVTCTTEGDWKWCEATLLPGQSFGAPLASLNACCDCDRVRKSIVCGHADPIEYRLVGSETWTTLVDSRYDVMGDCRGGNWLHPVDGVDFTCFEDLDTYCPARSATISSGPSSPSCVNEADFTFTSCASPDCECRIDSGSWSSCTSPFETLVTGVGEHEFYVRDMSDENPTPDQYTWTYDPNAPSCP